MAYTVTDFKTKKELKQAVVSYLDHNENSAVRCYQPGFGPDLSNFTGTVTLEGPHYPKPHKWYAKAELVNGIVVKVI